MIHTLRGNDEQALAALREAIDAGWRIEARYFLEHEPNLFSLHENLEFQQMVAEVNVDLEEQLARVQALEHEISQ